jgi:hypothetical protein
VDKFGNTKRCYRQNCYSYNPETGARWWFTHDSAFPHGPQRICPTGDDCRDALCAWAHFNREDEEKKLALQIEGEGECENLCKCRCDGDCQCECQDACQCHGEDDDEYDGESECNGEYDGEAAHTCE